MASKTLLLDLPNELFPFIFEYLRSIDILKAFSNVQCYRIQALIQSFIRKLDISQETDECIKNYLSNLFLQDGIIALRIQMKHLALISEYLLLSSSIQSVEVINWDHDFNFSNEIVCRLRQNLKRLSLKFAELGEIFHQDIPLLKSDSQLEHLIINNCVLYYSDNLEICTRLTYLSVELQGIHPLFLFIQHLPNLQKIKVKSCSQECYSETPPNTNGVKPCQTLRAVTFTGWIKYFDHLESFFATFGSTIEYVFLDISLIYLMVDGTRLERNLLDKMPRLTSFNLNIFSTFSDEFPIQIETFQNLTWQRLNPVFYWYDTHAQQQTLFTLPYKSDQFKQVSNDFVSTCVSNRPTSFRLERVHTLSLINTTPLNFDTFRLIEKVFPNLTTVELQEKDSHPLAEDDEDEEEKSVGVLSMNEDLLLDTSLKLPSVTKFCVTVCSQPTDYKTFHRFLRLFPNLVDIELNVNESLLHDLLKHRNDDDLIRITSTRITELNVISKGGSDILNEADILDSFPRLRVIKTEDYYT